MAEKAGASGKSKARSKKEKETPDVDAVLLESRFPPRFNVLLAFYDLVDKVYGFLFKRNLKCSMENIASMYGALIQYSILVDYPDYLQFSPDHLVQVCSFCPQDYLLTTFDVAEVTGMEDASLMPKVRSGVELQFKRFTGTGKVHSDKRRKLLTDAISTHLMNYYMPRFAAERSMGEIVRDINSKGWCTDHLQDINENCPFPSDAARRKVVRERQTYRALGISSPWSPQKVHKTSGNAPIVDGYQDNCAGALTYALDALRQSPSYRGQIAHVKYFPAREAVYGELSRPLPAALHHKVHHQLKIKRFYRHQAMAINALREGKHVIVSTSTASGKSLIYNVPVLERLCEDPASTALYLFPTKALTQDQLRSLLHFLDTSNCTTATTDHSDTNLSGKDTVPTDPHTTFERIPAVPVICDGDTPFEDRRALQQAATAGGRGGGNIVLTNPDMLHYTLLPEHKAYQRLFTNLSFVVLDEAHTYTGAFGIHVAGVLRRLIRIALAYRSRLPQFVLCSATLHNARDLMCKLLPLEAFALPYPSPQHLHMNKPDDCKQSDLDARLQLAVIDHTLDGSPHGERAFVLWNPYCASPEASTGTTTTNSNIISGADGTSRASKEEDEVLTEDEALREVLPEISLVSNVEDETSGAKTSAQSRKGGSYRRNHQHQHQLISPITEMAHVFTSCLSLSLRTMAFCRTRKLVELVYQRSRQLIVKQQLREKDQPPQSQQQQQQDQQKQGYEGLLQRMASYRGGYVDTERREIERALFQGELLGVAATNALELGIDVGSLDVTLHLGFPGSYASLWQQIGRAGRNGGPSSSSLAILLCFDCALDQYFAQHPANLLDPTRLEPCVLDTNNLLVLQQQLRCAAQEVPLNFAFQQLLPSDSGAQLTTRTIDDSALFGENYQTAVDLLCEQHQIRPVGRASSSTSVSSNSRTLFMHWSEGSYTRTEAARLVSLRMIAPVTFQVVDDSRSGFVLDHIEYQRAFFEVFVGAIYLHRGQQFLVQKLDLATHTAHALPVHVKYVTSARNSTEINVVRDVAQQQSLVHFGVVQVVNRVYGYVKKWLRTNEVFETGSCSLPPLEYETQALWIDVPQRICQLLTRPRARIRSAQGHKQHAAQDHRETASCLQSSDDAKDHYHNDIEVETDADAHTDTTADTDARKKNEDEEDEDYRCDLWASLHAANHALHVIGRLWSLGGGGGGSGDLACEHDVGGIYSANSPRLLLFDARPGGLGLSLHLFTRNQPAQLQPHSQPDAQTQQSQRSTSQEGTTNGGCDAPTASATSMLLLEEALHLMRDCKGCSRRCATGCPRCVLDGRCTRYNNHLDKRGAIRLLELLLAHLRSDSGSNTNAIGKSIESTANTVVNHVPADETRTLARDEGVDQEVDRGVQRGSEEVAKEVVRAVAKDVVLDLFADSSEDEDVDLNHHDVTNDPFSDQRHRYSDADNGMVSSTFSANAQTTEALDEERRSRTSHRQRSISSSSSDEGSIDKCIDEATDINTADRDRRKRTLDDPMQTSAIAETNPSVRSDAFTSPRKRQRQQQFLSLARATLRDSARSRSLVVQSRWTESIPNFVSLNDATTASSSSTSGAARENGTSR